MFLNQISLKGPHNLIKFGIWVYFILLIFEGALRKWVVPGLSTPLLIVRDPIALWIILTAYRHRIFPQTWYIGAVNFVAIYGILSAMSFGHGNIFVAIYGARVMFLHFPLIFIIGSIFDLDDVEKMGKAILWLALPMVILIALQFYSPQTAWVNKGVGGDEEGAGFSGVGEFMRPPGTFSFISGLVQFFSLVSAFILYFFIRSKKINKFLLIASAAALLIAIPMSISRSLFFNVIVELLLLLIAVSYKTRYFKKLFTLVGLGIITLMILSKTDFFQVSTGAFSERFEVANRAEGGIEGVFLDRFLGGMITAFSESSDQAFFGLGLGMGSNVGAQLLYGSTKKFLVAEEEWGRIIGELGPIIGLFFIFIRLHFGFSMLGKSFNQIRKENFLPWMLIGVGFLLLLQGQWSNSTSLGFSILIGGLLLASLDKNEKKEVIR